MADNVTNELLLEHLKATRAELSGLREDMSDLKRRMSSLELAVSQIHGDFAGQSMRIDRVELRLSRIDDRLQLTS